MHRSVGAMLNGMLLGVDGDRDGVRYLAMHQRGSRLCVEVPSILSFHAC